MVIAVVIVVLLVIALVAFLVMSSSGGKTATRPVAVDTSRKSVETP